jgi:activating signal cointegrator complex subunit 2
MKADILRRAEAMFEEEDKQENVPASSRALGTSGQDVFNPEDELEDAGIKVKVMGDSEESDENDTEASAEERETGPETIIELAWIRDPQLFNRDAATRRSKRREQLRKDTGE